MFALRTQILCLFVSGVIARAAIPQCETGQVSTGIPGGDFFGGSVAIDGQVAVVGDPASNEAVYVYRRSVFEWIQEAVLLSPHPDLVDGESFGGAVAISGDTIAVGASWSDGDGYHHGAVYLFERAGEAWLFRRRLEAADGTDNDLFGRRIALDGDLLVAAATDAEIGAIGRAGKLYVYRRSASSWRLESVLRAPDPQPNDALGFALSADHNSIIAAASNRTMMFRFLNGAWILEDVIHPPAADASFGAGVAVCDGTAVIGSPGYAAEQGRVYVFTRRPSKRPNALDDSLSACRSTLPTTGWEWHESAALTTEFSQGSQPRFGNAVALSDDQQTVVGTAPLDSTLAHHAGAAFLYRFIDGEWIESAKVTASDGQANDHFGLCVISDDTALIGAPGTTGGAGSAYFFAGIDGRDCDADSIPDTCEIHAGRESDLNGNGVPDACELPDPDGDGVVGFADLLMILEGWGSCPTPCPPFCGADVDFDCDVGLADLLAVLAAW